jgi:hypothetical protein
MTRAQDPNDDASETRIERSEHDYLDEPADIGRAVGNHTRELFVACEPAEALQQQLDFLRPRYLVLHDIGSRGAGKRLLHAVAAAAARPVERLTVRRQGYGTTLAAIDYVDCPTRDGSPVRLYSTDIDADTPSRTGLARVLLGHATLAVVLVGDVPAHAFGEALQPLRDWLFAPDWRCAHLQFMPLAPSSRAALAGLAGALGLGSGIQCQIAPLVTRPADAWAFLSSTWNHLQAAEFPDGRAPLLDPVAPGRDTMTPMPEHGAPEGVPVSPIKPIERFALEIHALNGVQAVCVFEITTSRVLTHAGSTFQGSELARRGSLLLAAGSSTRRQLRIIGQADEVLVMGGTQALGVRTLQSQPGLALHLVYHPAQTSWTQLRPRLMAMDATLPRAPLI